MVVCLEHGQCEWRSHTEKAFTPRKEVPFKSLDPGDPFITENNANPRVKICRLYRPYGPDGMVNAIWLHTGEAQHLPDTALVIPLSKDVVFKF